MSKDMLVHFIGAEAAVASLTDRRLDEISLPRRDNANLLGNIYLGEVENVLPGMQAAFVNIGLEKNSFLYVEDAVAVDGRLRGGERQSEGERDRSISDLVKKGQHIIVQIFKEPSGTKGARVTMQPSLPGRYLVLLPCGNYVAVSRRIENEEERERLKELIRAELPSNMGAIIRTVAEHADQQVLSGELRSLLKTWRRIQGWSVKSSAPSLLHSDMDLLERTVRDTNPADVDRIVTPDEDAFEKVTEVVGAIAPALKDKVVLEESQDLFLDYDVYAQLERALQRKVWLKSGGYIIIDQMEALTAIDVNTGKYVGERSLNDTVFKTNMEAVSEIARQLRLRNIGGIIIIDFIDMDSAEDKNRLLAALEEEMKKDRVRITVMGITQLGLVELTRKKIGHDLSSVLECECRACGGKGRISQIAQVFHLEKKA